MTICGPQPGKKPNKIATNGTKGNHKSKNILRSKLVKYMNISKTKKPLMTQVVTKFVVSITPEIKPRDVSGESWKSLKGFTDHIINDKYAPERPNKEVKVRSRGRL